MRVVAQLSSRKFWFPTTVFIPKISAEKKLLFCNLAPCSTASAIVKDRDTLEKTRMIKNARFVPKHRNFCFWRHRGCQGNSFNPEVVRNGSFWIFLHSPTCIPVPFGLQGIHTFWGGTKDSVFGTDNTVFATLSVLETNKNFAQSSPN